MRPDREGPGVAADKIGAVVRDAEVGDHLPRTGVVYLAEGDTVTQQREEAIRGLRAIRRGSAGSLRLHSVWSLRLRLVPTTFIPSDFCDFLLSLQLHPVPYALGVGSLPFGSRFPLVWG
jgi:hypothetical protein